MLCALNGARWGRCEEHTGSSLLSPRRYQPPSSSSRHLNTHPTPHTKTTHAHTHLSVRQHLAIGALLVLQSHANDTSRAIALPHPLSQPLPHGEGLGWEGGMDNVACVSLLQQRLPLQTLGGARGTGHAERRHTQVAASRPRGPAAAAPPRAAVGGPPHRPLLVRIGRLA